ncbi:MAG: lysine N(6)-hydroxylase/L-ornithine N(5)-oxygenase family protein [Propionibacteriaceae bacterium]
MSTSAISLNSSTDTDDVLDILGIGVGPFNLSLAALAAPLELKTRFVDRVDYFDWHPGMMLHGTHLQVPFMADLVTLADPTSTFSFLNFLSETERLYPFYIRENFNILRSEYNAYCRWAIDRLDSVEFGVEATDIDHDGQYYTACLTHSDGRKETVRARHLSLGVGTEPYVPAAAQPLCDAGRGWHTSDYLSRKTELLTGNKNVAIMGSGQSAAEVFLDLLTSKNWSASDSGRLTWVTRSPRFFPLEYTKLTLEMTSPEYIDHFRTMSQSERDDLVKSQHNLYKGINGDLINAIYDELYAQSVGMTRAQLDAGELGVDLFTNCELTASDSTGTLHFQHTETKLAGSFQADEIVLATGYRGRETTFLAAIEDRLTRLPDGRFDVDRNYGVSRVPGEVFVHNAEIHTHGFTSPDLGMGAYRNSIVLRQILQAQGKPAPYPIPERITFQVFGTPGATR